MRYEKNIFVTFALITLFVLPVAYGQQPTLKTQPGMELGVTFATYKYEEPSLAVKLDGTKTGVDFSAIGNVSNDWFVRGDARFKYGETDYTGSGTKCCNSDWYYDLRGTIGRDFDRGTYNLSPYLGLGYRYLFNDLRGVTSTGAIGYRRESQYTYLPVGLTHRFNLDSSARLATTLEYDYLIEGRQTSYLTDTAIPGSGDLVNKQRSGFGIRVNLSYERINWSVGPWFQYWNIDQSDTASAGLVTGFEPRNKTTEIGLRLGYRF